MGGNGESEGKGGEESEGEGGEGWTWGKMGGGRMGMGYGGR